jgi:hypothetical protein
MIKRGINYEGLCIKVDAASSSSHGLSGNLSGSLNHQSQLASGHQQQQLQAQPRKRIDFKLPPSVAEQPQPWHHQSAASTATASSRFSLSGGGGASGGAGHGGPPVETNPTSSVTTTSSHTNSTVSQASSHSQPNETKNISISSQPPSSIPLLPLVPSCLSSLTTSDDKEDPTISTASEDNGGLSKKE